MVAVGGHLAIMASGGGDASAATTAAARKESFSADIASMMASWGACSGALLKREKQLGTWKRRFFTLASAELRYFAREGDANPVGHVRVMGVSSVPAATAAATGGRPHRFDIECVARGGDARPMTLIVAAETVSDKERWVAAIEAAVHRSRCSFEAAPDPAVLTSTHGVADDAVVGDGAGSGPRPGLLLGITLQGVREFAERHWCGVCDPDVPGVRGATVPADAAERDTLVAVLRDAGHTNSWSGGLPSASGAGRRGAPRCKCPCSRRRG